jgi:hypothetical protein
MQTRTNVINMQKGYDKIVTKGYDRFFYAFWWKGRRKKYM